jgi:hypothetical protein
METFKIILLSVIAAVCYGILHDQITARISVEYFTIGHPIIIETTDPTTLGLLWGVLATWWAGLLVGIMFAIAAQAGTKPKRNARSLVRPILIVMVVMAVCAAGAGFVGWGATENNAFALPQQIARLVPRDRHIAFATAMWAHNASYLMGFVGATIAALVVARSRRFLPKGQASH